MKKACAAITFGLIEIRQRALIVGPNFFAREEDIDPAPRFALWSVDERIVSTLWESA